MKKFFALSVMLLGLAAATFAQTATSNATATIVTPITIAHDGTDLSFGNVLAPVAGTVTVDPAGTPTYSAGLSGSAAPALTAAVTAASFTVTGTPNALYTVTLPASVTLTGPAAATMLVDAFTSTPTTTAGAGQLGTPVGTQTLTVGATLNIALGQAAGTYTSLAPFTVTVGYN